MSEINQPAQPAPVPPASNSNRAWQIAFAVVVLLLLGGILFVVISDDADDTATDDTTTSLQTPTSTSGSGGTTSGGDSPQPDDSDPLPTAPSGDQVVTCSAGVLSAAAPAEVLAQEAVVVDYSCSPTSAGDLAGGFAWARFEAPGVDPLDVFYSAYVGDSDEGGPIFGDWIVVDYGTSVFCDDFVPPEACGEFLPNAPVR